MNAMKKRMQESIELKIKKQSNDIVVKDEGNL